MRRWPPWRATIRLTSFLLVVLLVTAPATAELPAPGGLVVEPLPSPDGQTALELRWKVVPGAVGYEVLQWRGGQWLFDDQDDNRIPLTTSTTIAGLQPGTTYRFSVRAVGANGQVSAQGEAAEGRTLVREVSISRGSVEEAPVTAGSRVDPKAPPPAAPTGLFAVFAEQEEVKLTWRKVSGAAGYYVEEEINGAWEPCDEVVGDRASNSVVILNHPTPGPYRFRVRAVGANGKSSEPSFPVTARR